jgi:hypothetical protein
VTIAPPLNELRVDEVETEDARGALQAGASWQDGKSDPFARCPLAGTSVHHQAYRGS